MADVTLTYKGNTIAELNDSGSKTIRTAGKFCEADIALEYIKTGTSVNWDGLIRGTWPAGEVLLSESVKSITKTYLAGNTAITSVNAPGVTSITVAAFKDCTHLTSVVFPKLTSFSSGPFYGAGSASGISGGPWVFPKLTAVPADGFRQIRASAVDLGPSCASIAARAFYQPAYGGYIPVLILRKTDAVVTVADTTALQKFNASSRIYVPASLVEAYKTATNWSTIGDIFYPIEGSIYETQYADGTPIT